jgi:hypothetical protein
MDQNELSLDPSHLGVPSGVSKMISEPIACSAQTVHQPCLEINTISKRTKMSFHLTRHLEVNRVRPKIFPCPWYIRRKPCTYLALRLTQSPSGPKQASTWPMSPRGSIRYAQNDFLAYCRFGTNGAPTLRRVSTISKVTETSFHLTHVT